MYVIPIIPGIMNDMDAQSMELVTLAASLMYKRLIAVDMIMNEFIPNHDCVSLFAVSVSITALCFHYLTFYHFLNILILLSFGTIL